MVRTRRPEVVITLGAGWAGNGPLTLGHFAGALAARAGQGVAGTARRRRGPVPGRPVVLATLLHEAAHGTAAPRKIPWAPKILSRVLTCSGGPLAGTELQGVFSVLVPRFPAMRLAEPAGQLTVRRDTLAGGLTRLPVTW